MASTRPRLHLPAWLAALTLALSLTTARAAAQSTAVYEPGVARALEFPLTIRNIMRGPELVGQDPEAVAWSDDSRWIYFRWLPGGHEWHAEPDLYRVAAEGGEPERLTDEQADSLAVSFSRGDLSPDRRLRVTAVRGDLYLVERSTGTTRRLTETTELESSPQFAADGHTVFFRREQNVFALDLADGTVRQLTDIRSGPAPPDEKEAEGHEAFLEEQQTELFEHIRIEAAREERREAERERRESERAEPLYLGSERAGGLDPDPTGSFVAVGAFTPAEGEERTHIPRWITASGYTEDTQMRAKVGDAQSTSRVGLLEVATGDVTWFDLVGSGSGTGEGEEVPTEAEGEAEGETAEEATQEAARAGAAGAATDKLAIARFAGWNDAGTHGLLFAIDRDFKAWRLYAVEAASGEHTLLDSLRDEAWVGGPCLGFGFGGGCVGWLPESAGSGGTPRAWYVSEETGFAHLYTIAADGSDKRQLTSGEWEVLDVEIPEGASVFLLHTSELSPFDRHPWTMAFDGSNRVQLIEGHGAFEATPSPDGMRLAVIHSLANRPPELYVAANGTGLAPSDLEQVTVSPTVEWLTFPWIQPDIIHFEARDGTRVPARIYRPSDLGAEPNGAGVVFVHGAGYLHNVHTWWSSYYREYMFHHFLAANGYTVLDIDYRGSAGYGRDWRTAIYRHMGGWDLTDQVDGAAWLVEAEGVDPDRLGIYGGSYGGFITLMALFTQPGVFEAGAALRSVTDWAHYNHPYTSRILNLPHEDEEAYRRSSPIYFAEGLEGHLLIAHGMYDTNVHFSDVVRLAQRLIELGKENWEMAVYPVENHSFREPSSWTDEYRRIFELFERVIGSGAGALTQEEGG